MLQEQRGDGRIAVELRGQLYDGLPGASCNVRTGYSEGGNPFHIGVAAGLQAGGQSDG